MKHHIIFWIAENEDILFVLAIIILMLALGVLVFMNSLIGGAIVGIIFCFICYSIDYCVKYKIKKSKNIRNTYY